MVATTFRFAIGSGTPLSEIWTVVSQGNDMYLTASSQKSQMKVSMHGSRVCQYAMLPEFFEQHGPAIGKALENRTILRWKREPTPDEGGLCGFRIIFAADGSWPNAASRPPRKATQLIPPPPPGAVVEVGLFYSRECIVDHREEVHGDANLLTTVQLAGGDHVALLYTYQPYGPEFFSPMPIPSTHGFMTHGFEFGPNDHEVTGLTMHFIMQSHVGMATLYSLHNMTLSRI